MLHVTHLDESRFTVWHQSSTSRRHHQVNHSFPMCATYTACPYMNKSCHTTKHVMSHTWMSHSTRTNHSCHTQEWVISHIQMSHQVQVEGIVRQILSNVIQRNESYHTYKSVTEHESKASSDKSLIPDVPLVPNKSSQRIRSCSAGSFKSVNWSRTCAWPSSLLHITGQRDR